MADASRQKLKLKIFRREASLRSAILRVVCSNKSGSRLSREIPTESGNPDWVGIFAFSENVFAPRWDCSETQKRRSVNFWQKEFEKRIIRDPDFVGTFLTHSKFTDLFQHEKRVNSVGLIWEIPTESGNPDWVENPDWVGNPDLFEHTSGDHSRLTQRARPFPENFSKKTWPVHFDINSPIEALVELIPKIGHVNWYLSYTGVPL